MKRTQSRRVVAPAFAVLSIALFAAYSNCSALTPMTIAPAVDVASAASAFARQPAAPAPTPMTASCSAGEFYIDPSQASNGAGTLASPFNDWSAATFAPGGCYYQKAGTASDFPTGWTLSPAGTPADIVLIGAYGSGARPILSGWVAFSGASYAQIKGFRLQASTTPGATAAAGISIINGSHHVQIVDNEIDGLPIGVWIGSAGGADNLILGNAISNSTYHGVAVDRVDGSSGHETYISGNAISDSGCHGIEVAANWYYVERNRVSGSGRTTSGCSGVHAYAGGFPDLATSPKFDGGSHLKIRYNVVFGAKDATGFDGNGIQLDQFTHDDVVYANLAYGNDGAGLNLFDSSSNVVTYNALVDNAKDSGASHGAFRAELLVGSDSTASQHFSGGNSFLYNEIIATQATGVAIAVDAISAGLGQTFAANWFANAASGGPAFKWGSTTGFNVFAWRSASGGGTDDALTGLPFYVPPTSGYAPMATFGPIAVTLDGQAKILASWDPATGIAVQ